MFMEWLREHKNGLVDAAIVGIVLAIIGHFAAISATIIRGEIAFRHFAYGMGAWWAAVIMWVVTFLVVWLIVTGGRYTYNWLVDPHPVSHLYRNRQYETALAALLDMVNRLEGKKTVPLETRFQMVRVLKLFERGVIDILGPRYQTAFRMIWVRPDPNDPLGVKFWTPKDRVGPRERDLIVKAFSMGQWIITVEPQTLEDEPRPENMRVIYGIRNMNTWQVGFVIAIDRWIPMPRVKKERLMSHLMMLMPLFEIAMMQRVILKMERTDWKTEVAVDDSKVAQSGTPSN